MSAGTNIDLTTSTEGVHVNTITIKAGDTIETLEGLRSVPAGALLKDDDGDTWLVMDDGQFTPITLSIADGSNLLSIERVANYWLPLLVASMPGPDAARPNLGIPQAGEAKATTIDGKEVLVDPEGNVFPVVNTEAQLDALPTDTVLRLLDDNYVPFVKSPNGRWGWANGGYAVDTDETVRKAVVKEGAAVLWVGSSTITSA